MKIMNGVSIKINYISGYTQQITIGFLLIIINIQGISLAEDESTASNNTTELVESLKTENVNNSTKSDGEYLSLDDGIEFAYPSADQTAPNEELLVKETELNVDDLRKQLSLL